MDTITTASGSTAAICMLSLPTRLPTIVSPGVVVMKRTPNVVVQITRPYEQVCIEHDIHLLVGSSYLDYKCCSTGNYTASSILYYLYPLTDHHIFYSSHLEIYMLTTLHI